MGYWLAVRRVAHEGARHTYAYGREGALDGHLTLDEEQAVLFPSDAAGVRTSTASVGADGGSESRGDLARESWRRFVEAAAAVLRRTATEGEPPQVADRVYG